MTIEEIENRQTGTLKRGDVVIMHSYIEAKTHNGTFWKCMTPSFKDFGGEEVVFLEGYSGSLLTRYLQWVKNEL